MYLYSGTQTVPKTACFLMFWGKLRLSGKFSKSCADTIHVHTNSHVCAKFSESEEEVTKTMCDIMENS